MKPVRIQRSRQHKQVSPNGLPIVYVGRPGKWGNPYQVGVEEWDPRSSRGETVIPKTVDECLELFKVFLLQVNKNWTESNIHELRGKNLSCWCPLDCKCHADVLLELANQ